MLFRSNFAAFRKVVRHEINVPHPTLPTFIDKIKALRAEFGHLGDEYQFEHADGAVTTHADIRGHFFDSVSAQEANGWTDDERKEVEDSLISLASVWPEAVQIIEHPKAALPWPSYDSMDEKKIISFAVETGLIEAALRYEVENKNRDLIVIELRKEFEKTETPDEEELAVA